MKRYGGLSVLRAVLAPTHKTYDVLTRYEMLRGQSLSESPCLVYAVFVMAGLLLLAMSTSSRWAAGSCLAPIVVLWGYSVLARWRLIFATASRLARTISARRLTGDWDLIRVIPMPKARWLNIQMVTTGWQIWPLVKGLIFAQGIIAVVYYFLLLIETSIMNRSCFSEPCPQRLSGFSFLVMGLPLLALWIFVPVIETGLIVSVSGLVSSYIKRPGFSIAAGFIGVLVTRVVLVLTGWIIAYMLYRGVAVNAGWIDPPRYAWEQSEYTLFPTIYELILMTLFWEWLPAIGLGEISTHYGNSTEHAALYLIAAGTILMSYGIFPLGLMHLLFKWTARRLEGN